MLCTSTVMLHPRTPSGFPAFLLVRTLLRAETALAFASYRPLDRKLSKVVADMKEEKWKMENKERKRKVE